MPIQTSSPLFSRKNALEFIISIACFLLILLGFFTYDAFNWYVRARNWPFQQAGLDSSGYCGRTSRTECTFVVEYTHQGQTYHQKITLPKIEYTDRLNALRPGEDSKSILVDIKINPEHPEFIIADPKIQLSIIGGICILGLSAIALLLVVARSLGRI